MDEVAHLTTISISIPAAKQTNTALLAELVEIMKSDRCHTAFVLFSWAIDIKITQTDHRRSQCIQMATQDLIEQELGIAVHVKWRFVADVLYIVGTRTVDGSRRGI